MYQFLKCDHLLTYLQRLVQQCEKQFLSSQETESELQEKLRTTEGELSQVHSACDTLQSSVEQYLSENERLLRELEQVCHCHAQRYELLSV